MEVSIPSKLHNSLIGAKGRFIRSIMEECGGVHIHFPTEGSGSDTVTIRGPAQDVEKAKKQLLHLAEEKVSLVLEGKEQVGFASCFFWGVEVIPSVYVEAFGISQTNPLLRDLRAVWMMKRRLYFHPCGNEFFSHGYKNCL